MPLGSITFISQEKSRQDQAKWDRPSLFDVQKGNQDGGCLVLFTVAGLDARATLLRP